MIQSDKILTLHPEGKNGVNIDREKYNLMKEYILETVRKHSGISYKELNERANTDLEGTLSMSIPWYLVTVKLDLEARGLIERIPGTSPQQLRIPE